MFVTDLLVHLAIAHQVERDAKQAAGIRADRLATAKIHLPRWVDPDPAFHRPTTDQTGDNQ